MSEDNGLSRYVVQRFYDDEGVWKDVGEQVEAPARTKRRTILRRALGASPAAGEYRVLDAESARSITVTLEDQDPRVVIG